MLIFNQRIASVIIYEQAINKELTNKELVQ